MDRTTIIGFVLIGLVLMVWMWMNAPPPQPPQQQAARVDSVTHNARRDSVAPPSSGKTEVSRDSLGKYFGRLATGPVSEITIESPLFRAILTTNGGGVRSWELRNYKTWDQRPVNFMEGMSRGDCNLLFYTTDGKLIDTRNLVFRSGAGRNTTIVLSENDSLRVDFLLPVQSGTSIGKSLTFHGNSYAYDVAFRLEGMQEIIANYEYQVTWASGLRYFEHNSIDESNNAKAAAMAGGEMTEVDAKDPAQPVKQNISGRVTWVAMRNKYFTVAMLPRAQESQGAYLEGYRTKEADNGALEHYVFALKMPYQGQQVVNNRVTMYQGPLEFDIIRGYGVDLEKIMSLGAAWVIRPISEYVIIPVFKFLHLFIPNYGLVLIFFSLIVKVVLYPLTKSSMVSMRKMQKLQPMMNEIREKNKDDPQKMNQQIMRLYKEYGVNPAGGCLPMLLQLPILYALWSVFGSTIELRQASFIWWIHDLSVPDVIMTLPFQLPIFAIEKVSGLALLMGVTMFVQQKMAVQDPRQKMMVWLMPIMLTLLFNSFPAGLNLYYFFFNALSIAQQAYMNKSHSDEPLRKVEEKKGSGGFMARLTKNLPKPPR